MTVTENRRAVYADGEEALLIRRAQNGDGNSASQLFERYRMGMHSYLA